MRIEIDIDDAQVKELEKLAERSGKTRESMIRQALAEYIDRRTPAPLDEAFGLWRDRKVDGLEYQDKVRSEW